MTRLPSRTLARQLALAGLGISTLTAQQLTAQQPTARPGTAAATPGPAELLKRMATGFSTALVGAGWAVGDVLHQTQIYPQCVQTAGVQVAYVLVDAMRFEMGVALAGQLQARNVGRSWRCRVVTGTLQNIGTVDTTGHDPYQHLTRAKGGRRAICQAQYVRRTKAGNFDDFHSI